MEKQLRRAADCVNDAYHDHMGRLQGEELATIPALKKERGKILEGLRFAIALVRRGHSVSLVEMGEVKFKRGNIL